MPSSKTMAEVREVTGYELAALPPVVGWVLARCNPLCVSDRVDLPMAGCRGLQ